MEDPQEEEKKKKKVPTAAHRNTFLVHMASVEQYKRWKDANAWKPGYDGKHFPGLDIVLIATDVARWTNTTRKLRESEVRGHIERLVPFGLLRRQKDKVGWNRPYPCYTVPSAGEDLYDRLTTIKIDGILPAEHICHKGSELSWKAFVVSAVFAITNPLTDEDVADLSSLTVSSVKEGRRKAEKGFELKTPASTTKIFKVVFQRFSKKNEPTTYALHPDQWVVSDNGTEGVMEAIASKPIPSRPVVPVQISDSPVLALAPTVDEGTDMNTTTTQPLDQASDLVVEVPSLVELVRSAALRGRASNKISDESQDEAPKDESQDEAPKDETHCLLMLEIPMAQAELFSKVASAAGHETVEAFLKIKLSVLEQGLRSKAGPLLEARAKAAEKLAQMDALLAVM